MYRIYLEIDTLAKSEEEAKVLAHKFGKQIFEDEYVFAVTGDGKQISQKDLDFDEVEYQKPRISSTKAAFY